MDGRVINSALVTGGGSGMGRAVALRLAGENTQVFVADIDLEAAGDVATQIIQNNGMAQALAVDVGDAGSVERMYDFVAGQVQGLDMLVHCAAIMGDTAFIQDVSDEQWRRMMTITLDGAFYCARGAVRLMAQSGGGRILLFSSVASLTPTPGALPYSAAKGGVNMLGRTLALEAAKHNIKVNVVAPGYIDTPMLNALPQGFGDHIIKKTPLKRLGKVEEIAGLVAFLASPEADFITGQIISPNGGLVI